MGAVLVLAGVVDLVTGKQSVILGVGLTAVGAANCLKGLLDRRFANRNAKPS